MSEYSARVPGGASSGTRISGIEHRRWRMVLLEEPQIAGESRGMREQGAERDVVPVRVGSGAGGEFRQDFGERRFEPEYASVVEQHGDGGGGHDFGDAGQIEYGGSRDGRRVRLIGESAHRVERDHLLIQENSIGGTGEGAVTYGLLQHGMGGGKAPRAVVCGRRKRGVGSGHLVRIWYGISGLA